MIFFSFIIILVIYMMFLKKHREMIKYIPLSKKGVLNLYQKVVLHPSKYSLYLLYLKMFSNVFLVIVMAVSLKLNPKYIMLLTVITLSFIPFVLIWNLNHDLSMQEFNNLELYLTQFILIFKSHHKVIYVLYELEKILEGKVKEAASKAIKMYEEGQDTNECLKTISEAYPHFIVYNLHVLVLNVETFGSSDYSEGLDLIQDDIDDWSEDILVYNHQKKDIIKKVNILICFAFLISVMALKMLFAVSLSTDTMMYQMTMFIFCFIEVTTYVMTQSIINEPFIQKSEVLC